MSRITPKTIQKLEYFSLFLNNVFLLLGMLFFGWTLFATLFLYCLELLAAVVVLNYLHLWIPRKYGRPGYHHLPEYRQPALKILGLSCYALIAHSFVLLLLIDLHGDPNWQLSAGIGLALAQLPQQLWQQDILIISLLFLVIYLLPFFMLERRGIRPSEATLPAQVRIMTHRSQFVVTYIWFACLALAHYGLGIQHPLALISLLMLLKTVYEVFLFRYLSRQMLF